MLLFVNETKSEEAESIHSSDGFCQFNGKRTSENRASQLRLYSHHKAKTKVISFGNSVS